MNETNDTIVLELENISNSLRLQLLLPLKIFIILGTVFLNLKIIYIIIFLLKKRTYSNLLFLSKSFADLLVGLISMPCMTVYTCFGYWPGGYGLCVFWIIFDFASCCISIINLLLITWHRYRQLTSPFDVTEDMNAMNYFKMALAWIIPFAFWIGSVLPITSENFITENCYYMYTVTYVLLADSIAYSIPITTLLILNFLTYRALKVKSKRISPGTGTATTTATVTARTMTVDRTVDVTYDGNNSSIIAPGQTRSNKQKATVKKPSINKDRKAVTCIIVVSVLLALCWIIFVVTWPVQAACNCVDAILYEAGYWLAYIYSLLYPISLLIFHESIKKKFLSFIKKKGN